MSVSFSPSGEFVLAASNDNAVRVWDFAFARAHSNLMGHSGKVYTAKFTGDSLKVWINCYAKAMLTLSGCNRFS